MSQKGFAPVLLLVGLVLVAAIGGGGFYLGQKYTATNNNLPPENLMTAPVPISSPEIIDSSPATSPLILPTPTASVTTVVPSPTAVSVPAAIPSNLKSYTSTTYNYSLTYPSNWNLQRISEGYDAPLVKITGPKNSTGYAPTLYISPTSPFSSSGAICANTNCTKTGTVSLKIKGGNYTTDIVDANDSSRYYLSLPGKMVKPQGYNSSIPLNIYASYQTDGEAKAISDIISSITY